MQVIWRFLLFLNTIHLNKQGGIMSNISKKVSVGAIVGTQILFLVALVFFHNMVIVGPSFLRVLTEEEWEWLCHLPNDPQRIKITAFFSFFTIIFIILLLFSYEEYYRNGLKKHTIKPIDFILPLIGFVIYAPLFYYTKYYAEHFYIWMELLPLAIAAVILQYLLLFSQTFKREQVQ